MGEHHPAQSTRRGICNAAEEGQTARYTREASYNAPADGALHAVLGEHCAMWYPRRGGIHWTGLLDGGGIQGEGEYTVRGYWTEGYSTRG